MTEEKFCSLSDTSADGAQQLVLSEREHREQFKELSLLRARGSKLCLVIVGLPRVRNHLSDRMRAAILHHTEMARELAALWATVSSAVELVLGCSPDETFLVDVMDELVPEFWRLGELFSWLKWPGTRICDLLLGPPLGQARWTDHLDGATRQLGAELATRREVDAELEALCEFGIWCWTTSTGCLLWRHLCLR
jgi:hypothetical protein